MAAAQRPWAAELLHIWFEEMEPADWFKPNSRMDHQLRVRFERKLMSLGAEPASNFTRDLKLAQAAILLFDQVPRNLFRKTAQAFAYDALARDIAKHVIAQGWDAELPDEQRQFIAMPLMHSEDIADQEASVAYFTEHLPKNVEFAKSHHEMIARFGRFPHRNKALERETTEEEQAAIDEGFSW
ncbi:DUF924 family protein [Altererythrobacter sp. ZODW24]|uniref:DUF924 family protein n=1 Tax=Altererythrobacter sp. ZODW24 TaxID=2185142 RepID=UPI000DF78CFA|nr:DUF924 family protein [Altererythrobacter sp. ZODW24]